MQNIFEIKDDIYMNGERFRIISGSIHYFRVVPEYWRDRLEKLKAMGCNTVETYVAWTMRLFLQTENRLRYAMTARWTGRRDLLKKMTAVLWIYLWRTWEE